MYNSFHLVNVDEFTIGGTDLLGIKIHHHTLQLGKKSHLVCASIFLTPISGGQ